MSKIVKLIVLTSKEILVSEIEEVGAEVGEPDCKLIHPVILKTTEEKLLLKKVRFFFHHGYKVLHQTLHLC